MKKELLRFLEIGFRYLSNVRIQDRAFVLVPLAEVAPDWTHPILGVTVDELKNALPNEEIEAIQRISGQNAPN